MNNIHLSQLLAMPKEEFERYRVAVAQIAEWRQSEDAAQSSPVVISKQMDATQSKALANVLPRRSPMRVPKTNSLRGTVHKLLRNAGTPLQRATIISEVAKQRGEQVGDNLKAKIGDILTNRHDSFIRRVGHGIYTFANNE